jgi:23S rRNA pseudouridine2605 synthase
MCAQQNKIGATLSSAPEFNETQLLAARAKAWHQEGDAVLTLEAARDWINAYGLVLFAPRVQQLPAPAPSLVEATLGKANGAPTMAETETARGLVSRLVGEGLALPLNLMNVPGDSPDFVVSAQVFSYIFTMRGDKAWKQPPSTSGAVKVSPLGLRVFEVLTERGPMSASELASELGREVTEAAILRSLSELWSQLRVLPLLQVGDGGTLWELTSRRFTKAIKAGANAGQPTALSALISLYLGQVSAATEEDIATFLSPLTARSRVREVLHALMGARQLETVVLDGKTLLHIPGGLPAGGVSQVDAETAEADAVVPAERPKKIGTGRIKSFSAEGKTAGEFRGKPVRNFAAGRAGAGSTRPSARFGARTEGKPERERRPFKKDGVAGKPTFTKPWEEDRKPRAEKAPADSFTKFRKPAPEDREPLGPREQAGLPTEKRIYPSKGKPAARSFERAGKPGGFAKRPYTPRTEEGGARPAFKPRTFGREDGDGGRKPAFGAKRPYTPRATEGDGARPFAKRPYSPRASEGGTERPAAKRPYAPRTADAGERPAFKPRSYEKRSGEAKPSGFAKRPYTPRATEGGERPYPKRTFTPRESEGTGERTLPKRPYKPRAADADQRPFTKAPWTPSESDGGAPKRAFKPRAGAGPRKSFGSKPGGSFSGKPKFGGKPGGFGAKRGPSAGRPAGRKPETKD